jgi:hypothetical protein
MSSLSGRSIALIGCTALAAVGLFCLGQPMSALAGGAHARTLTAYVTGYSYWDNTPPGSAEISKPVVHARAGGRGTYSDPITLAVGHAIVGGRETLDVPAGTRFYLSGLKKYAIVEDTCGDGPTPQNEPCHTGHAGHAWFDLYVDGSRSTSAEAHACANRITALRTVIMNPPPNLPVVPGGLTESGCKNSAG